MLNNNIMEKKILVTGGEGLVGSNLIARLKEVEISFVATKHADNDSAKKNDFVPYDLCKFEDCLSATKNKSAVVFCAAISYGAKKNKETPTASILPNLKIIAGLLEACACNNVKQVIMFSSATIYQPVNSPIEEDALDLNQSPYQGYFGVAWTYRYLEKLAILYSKIYGMQISVLRPTSIYGPFDKFDEDRAHVVPSLIRRALKKEDPFEVWGSPEVIRDFIFVDDLVEDILSILFNKVDTQGLPVNICSDKPISIHEAAETILDVCNHKTKIYYNKEKPSAIPYQGVNNTRYMQLFGVRKRTTFRVGIEKTVEWYKKFANV